MSICSRVSLYRAATQLASHPETFLSDNSTDSPHPPCGVDVVRSVIISRILGTSNVPIRNARISDKRPNYEPQDYSLSHAPEHPSHFTPFQKWNTDVTRNPAITLLLSEIETLQVVPISYSEDYREIDVKVNER